MSETTELNLSNTSLTDARLKELAGLKSLKSLDISGCASLAPRGVAEIKKALPGVVVVEAPKVET
jgi:hypothetical protein